MTELMIFAGGIPLTVSGVIVGAVGVSGGGGRMQLDPMIPGRERGLPSDMQQYEANASLISRRGPAFGSLEAVFESGVIERFSRNWRNGRPRSRQKLVETGAVDVMIDIRGNFFYTRTVPCQLWFFDRAKEKDEGRRDHVMMWTRAVYIARSRDRRLQPPCRRECRIWRPFPSPFPNQEPVGSARR